MGKQLSQNTIVILTAGERMLSTVFLTIFIVGGNLAMDENEWRDGAVEVYYKLTKYFEEHDYDKLVDLFYDGGVELFPNGPPVEKGGMEPMLEKMPLLSEYFAFLELLYSSPDMAVTRHVGYRKQVDGTVNKFKGIILLVQESGKVRIKMGGYNSD